MNDQYISEELSNRRHLVGKCDSLYIFPTMQGYMRHFIANSRNLYNQWLNKVILEDVMCLTWSFNPDSSWSSKFIVLIIIKRHRSPCVYILYVLISSRRRSVQTWKAWEMSTKSHCLLEPAIKIKPRARWEAVKIHFLTKFQPLKKTNLIASPRIRWHSSSSRQPTTQESSDDC